MKLIEFLKIIDFIVVKVHQFKPKAWELKLKVRIIEIDPVSQHSE